MHNYFTRKLMQCYFTKVSHYQFVRQRNWVFTKNSNFLIPISLQPDAVNRWYFKLRLFDLTEFKVWNIKGLRHWVAKIFAFSRNFAFSQNVASICFAKKCEKNNAKISRKKIMRKFRKNPKIWRKIHSFIVMVERK